MKSWLAIATALACGFGINASGADARSALTPTDLNMLARVSDPQVSPDGRYVVYVQRETDLEGNRGRSDLWLLDLEGSNTKPRRLTPVTGRRPTPCAPSRAARWPPRAAARSW